MLAEPQAACIASKPPGSESEAELARVARELEAANRQLDLVNERLRRSEARLRAAMDMGRLGAWEFDLRTGIIERSPLCDQILGLSITPSSWRYEDALSQVIPEDRDCVEAGLQRVLSYGQAWSGDCRIRRADNGTLRWVQFHGMPLHDAEGRTAHIVGVVADISDAKRAAERQQLLLAELNHRVKNAFATCQSMVTHTLRNSGSLDEARKLLVARLVALGHAQDLLTQTSGSGALLAEVLTQTLSPFVEADPSDSRLAVAGPEVVLAPKAVVALHAAFHELATNAANHGALSVPVGGVSVTWAIQERDGAAKVTIIWSEHGGPPAREPRQRGFGFRLVERCVTGELGGKLEAAFVPAGLQVEIEIPLSRWAWRL